jgi:hypothetical protein
VDFNLPSNWWVSQLQKSKFAVLDLGFEMLGLGLDNRGRTTKNAYCRIYSLWLIHGWKMSTSKPSRRVSYSMMVCAMAAIGYISLPEMYSNRYIYKSLRSFEICCNIWYMKKLHHLFRISIARTGSSLLCDMDNNNGFLWSKSVRYVFPQLDTYLSMKCTVTDTYKKV